MSKYIAIIQTGEPIASAFEKYGDFDALFIKHMQIDSSLTKTFRVFKSIAFPQVNELAGIIITGSPAMVTEQHEWSEQTIDWLRKIINAKVPILGVCYGHQLLGIALQGQVDWNPNGRQIGRVKIILEKHAYVDPLFSSLIDSQQTSIDYYATHLQSVTVLPESVTLLGSTNLDPYHCFRYDKHVWGLQFHPEFNAKVIQDYVNTRSQDIENEGLNPNKILTEIKENNNGTILLKRFKDLCFNA